MRKSLSHSQKGFGPIVVVVTIAVLIAGTAVGIKLFPQLGGYFLQVVKPPQESPEPLWNTPEIEVLGKPALHNNLVIVGSISGDIYALDRTSGKEVWRHNEPNGNFIYSAPVVSKGLVFATSLDGVQTLDANTGKQLWENEMFEGFGVTIAVEDKLLYTATNHNKLVALKISDGSLVWEFSGEGGDTLGSPVLCNTFLLVPGRYNFYVLEKDTGKLKWKMSTESTAGTPECDGKLLYYTTTAPVKAWAFDLQTGEKIWSALLSPIDAVQVVNPILVDGVLYIGNDAGGDLFALSATSGDLVWKRHFTRDTRRTPAVNDSSKLVYLGTFNNLYAVNTKTGKIVWVYDTKGAYVGTPLLSEAGVLYVGTRDSGVFAFPAE